MTKTFSWLLKKLRAADFSNVFVFCLFALLVDGCATPVGINPVDIQTGYQLNTESALSVGQTSEASKTVLRRNGLMDRFNTEPAAVLAELHAGLKPTDDEEKLFALAELSLLHGQNTGDHAYFLATAVYAWSILFPGDSSVVQLKASDPRFRLTYDFYNQALALGLADPREEDQGEFEVHLKPGDYKLPFGNLHITMDESGLSWGGYQLERFVSTTSLEVRGLRNRYRTPGLGASLAASIATGKDAAKIIGSERLGPRTKVPVSAILRLEHARTSLTNGQVSG